MNINKSSLAILALFLVVSCKNECEEIIDYYGNGNIAVKYVYPDCDNRKIYKEVRFYRTGELNGEKFIHPDSAMISYKTWFKNGQLSAKWHELNGKEHGIIKCWYENGVLWKRMEFNHGEKHGSYEVWFDSGDKNVSAQYKGGLRIGKSIIYDTLKGYSILNYRQDTIHGPAYEFNIDVNGDTTIVSGQYYDGLEEGEWKIYDSDSNLLKTVDYRKGKIFSSIK